MIRDPIRRTVGRSAAGRGRPRFIHTGKCIQGGGRTERRCYLPDTRSHTRDSVHIYTCLASAGARDLRKYWRAKEDAWKFIPPPPPSLPLIADHRSARDGKRVKPSDRLFARRINICSSACFYVCPDNFVAHGTRARVMFAPTFLPPPLTIISEISQGAAHVYQSVRVSQVGDAITRLENWWIWSETRIEIWRFLLKDDFLICLVRYVGIFKCIEIGRGWFWIYLYDN